MECKSHSKIKGQEKINLLIGKVCFEVGKLQQLSSPGCETRMTAAKGRREFRFQKACVDENREEESWQREGDVL